MTLMAVARIPSKVQLFYYLSMLLTAIPWKFLYAVALHLDRRLHLTIV